MLTRPLCSERGTSIADVADALSAHTPQSFLAAHPMPCLISQGAWTPGEGSGESTRIAAGARYRTPSGAPTIADESHFWQLRKHHHTFPSKVTVGRMTNNDVVIPHPTISKFHAFFSIREDGTYLVEAGSKNATYHNGDRVTKELKPRLIQEEDVLQFGEGPALILITAASLLQILAGGRI
ncbi:MAG: FHA domain-containing protein [Planctomycetota bacterium]|jgi:hypothetical protein